LNIDASAGEDPMAAVQNLVVKAQGSGAGGVPPTGVPGGTNPNVGGETQASTPFAVDRNASQPLGPVSPKALEQMGGEYAG